MAKLTKAQIAAQTEAKRRANKIKLFDLMHRCLAEPELNIEFELTTPADDKYGAIDEVGVTFYHWEILDKGDELARGTNKHTVLTPSSDNWLFEDMDKTFQDSKLYLEQQKQYAAERKAIIAKLSDYERKRLGVS